MLTEKDIIRMIVDADPSQRMSGSRLIRAIENNGYHGKMWSDSGASKYCVWFKDFPGWVIKWSCYDNSALAEVAIYEDAVKAGIAHLFPRTSVLINVNGIAFILQERVEYSARDVPDRILTRYDRMTQTVRADARQKMNQRITKIARGNNSRNLDIIWAKMVCLLYGRRTCIAFCEFAEKHKINDLHSNNLGYIRHKPVVLDFCGYNNGNF